MARGWHCDGRRSRGNRASRRASSSKKLRVYGVVCVIDRSWRREREGGREGGRERRSRCSDSNELARRFFFFLERAGSESRRSVGSGSTLQPSTAGSTRRRARGRQAAVLRTRVALSGRTLRISAILRGLRQGRIGSDERRRRREPQ